MDGHATDRFIRCRKSRYGIWRQYFCCTTCWRRTVYLRRNNGLDKVPFNHSAVGSVYIVLGGALQWTNQTKNFYWIEYKLVFWISPTHLGAKAWGCFSRFMLMDNTAGHNRRQYRQLADRLLTAATRSGQTAKTELSPIHAQLLTGSL